MSDKQSIKVSVIVAVYNAEKYLRQCLDSIAGQTLKDTEIICVNDGSTDNSLAILEEYVARDERFRVLTKENEGLGGASARNLGLDHAKGEYISILDSDDFFDPDMLKKAVQRAEETEADLVVFGGCEYDEYQKTYRKVASILNESVVPDKDVFSCRDCAGKIYQLSQGMAWNKLFRRSFLEKHNLRFQRIKYTDDAYFTFAHMALAERIAVVKESLCYYRVNTGTNQTAGISNYPDSSYRPYLTLKESLINWGVYDLVKQSFINCAATFMRHCYDQIDRFEPFQYLHEKFREEVFDSLDISRQEKEFFYDARVYMWCRQVMEHSAGELAFNCARAHGCSDTSSILRFQFPRERIPEGSKVALIGAGIMGRHLFSQMILDAYVDITVWVSDVNDNRHHFIQWYDALKNAEFDYALIAFERPDLIREAVSFLKELGITNEKIILQGGTLK